ncbi:MAG: serine/threonine-protein kinase [Lachnospiraceae bacterium]|nr:serine/threonine-protein kinase [Lachnospiraceae bacterium]
MSQLNTWPGWECVRQIGAGAFGKVYEIQREEYGKVYKAALKVITIPQNPSEVQDAYSEGMDEKSVTKYFHSFVQNITDEFALMSTLKGHSNIVSYEDHMVMEHEDEIGWDILIRMELLTPLQMWQKEHPLAEHDVIKLGCDICHALQLCQKRNIVHRDIKPENIFINDYNDYKLGDFGIARTVEKTVSNLSKKGTYTYMAPEVYLGKPYGATADIYSLGTVLYRYLNENRAPFLPLGEIRYEDREKALTKRMQGCEIPPPVHGSEELKSVVLKAIAFDPKDRYQTATEFGRALEKCVIEKTEEMEEYNENTLHLVTSNVTIHATNAVLLNAGDGEKTEMINPYKQPIAEREAVSANDTSGNGKLIVLCAFLLLVLILVVVGGISLITKNSRQEETVKKTEQVSVQEPDAEEVQDTPENEISEDGTTEEVSGEESSLRTELVWVPKSSVNNIDSYVYEYEYNEYGREIKEMVYNLSGDLQMWQEVEYDSEGHKIIGKWYFADGSDGMWTQYERDSLKEERIEYNPDGSLYAKYDVVYDEYENVLEKTTYNPDGTIKTIQKFGYDAQGNKVSDKRYYGDGTMYIWREMQYDTQGCEISRVAYEADGTVSRRYKVNYDRYNNPIEVVKYTDDQRALGTYAPWSGLDDMDFENCYMEYQYDEEGNMLERTMLSQDGDVLRHTEYQCMTAKLYENEILD